MRARDLVAQVVLHDLAAPHIHRLAKRWGLSSGKSVKQTEKDLKEERRFAELTDAEKLNPPLSKVKTPLFEAKVEPDIYFFGFDLDDEEARGELNPTLLTDNPGWFFVIKERPGEPRFGLDIEKAKNEKAYVFQSPQAGSLPLRGTGSTRAAKH
jgi:hypothetical protein